MTSIPIPSEEVGAIFTAEDGDKVIHYMTSRSSPTEPYIAEEIEIHLTGRIWNGEGWEMKGSQ